MPDEQELRIELMMTEIDKNRLDIERIRLDIDRTRQEMRWEVPKAVAGISLADIAAAGLILGLAHILPSPPPSPPPVIINIPAMPK